MIDPAAAALPSLEEARAWVGCELDDSAGTSVGRVEGVYVDAAVGEPVWLAVRTGRRRRAKSVVVPVRECAALPGRVWTAQERAIVLGGHTVDPSRSLLREHEIPICAHYGIGERVGRHAEVASREPGSVTAQPLLP